jgi:hypothetical protein
MRVKTNWCFACCCLDVLLCGCYYDCWPVVDRQLHTAPSPKVCQNDTEVLSLQDTIVQVVKWEKFETHCSSNTNLSNHISARTINGTIRFKRSRVKPRSKANSKNRFKTQVRQVKTADCVVRCTCALLVRRSGGCTGCVDVRFPAWPLPLIAWQKMD